jgi:DUF1680 family protein
MAALLAGRGETDFSHSPYAKLKSVGMTDARWTGGFWGERFDLAKNVILPEMWRTMQIRGNGAWYGNLRIAAGLDQGQFQGNKWSDGDVYKWLESAALLYAATGDKELDTLMDSVIAVIAKAQAPDGYISTNIQLGKQQRWTEPRNHEMYNMGHLLTAAAIHHRATGKTSLVAVAKRAGDYLYGQFQSRPPQLAHFGAPSNVMGIVEFYRDTADPRFLELSKIFVDMRGSAPGGTDHFQDRIPLRREKQAIGHAVHATYLYATAADVYAETGEKALWDALDRIWSNVVTRKIYVTGAVGPLDPGVSPHHDVMVEAFGGDYELPNRRGYNETCANVGNAMWNRRMLAITGEARYADVMELVLYNSMLSGMGLSGKDWFYANVHRRFGDEQPLLRNESLTRWKNTTEPDAAGSYCCPPNVLRTIAKSPEWAYSISQGAVWVNLYGASRLDTKLPDGSAATLAQETDYPWSGEVKVRIERAPAGEMALHLRIPGWAESARIALNGKPLAIALRSSTFAEVRRKWSRGDIVELALPMPARLVEANPVMEFTRGQVAVMRGPIVYCLESPDLPPGVRVSEVRLPGGVVLEPRMENGRLGRITVLEGSARRDPEGSWTDLLYRTLRPSAAEAVRLRLIPYYAWANRGVSHMTVWMPLAR